MSILEEFKDVPNYEGIYQVSNFGRVKNLRTNYFPKLYKERTGYYSVQLWYKGKMKKWNIHRLVASVFIRPLSLTEDVHHKNQMKCCNCLNNLQIINESKHNSMHKQNMSEQTLQKLSRTWFKKGRIVPEEQKQKRRQTLKLKRNGGVL